MSTQYTDFPTVSSTKGFSWTGIFAGTFLYLAIEATFGMLGVGVFASAANPQAANPVGFGIGAGAGIWMVILSIIALYFGGRLAGKLSGAPTRNIGMYAGLVTFGMSIFATILIIALMLGSTVSGATGVSGAGPARFDDILATGGYWVFVALILSMISAAFGGMHGAGSIVRRQPPVERPGEPRKAA